MSRLELKKRDFTPGQETFCQICVDAGVAQEQVVFTSKTKLFKHLEASHAWVSPNARPVKCVAIVGWISEERTDSDEWIKDTSQGEQVASSTKDFLESSFACALYSLETGMSLEQVKAEAAEVSVRPRGFSRASSGSRTGSVLGIEPSAHGVGDIFCFTMKASLAANEAQLGKWIDDMNALLPSSMRVFTCQVLPCNGCDFHGEISCTQRLYEYLIPMRSLMPADSSEIDAIAADFLQGKNLEPRKPTWKVKAGKMDEAFPTDTEEGAARVKFFRVLKFIFKFFAGRGLHMHNFVAGGACPDDSASLRRIDRFYHKEILLDEQDKQWVVFSVSGDAFARGQVRNMIGLIMALTRGWLPFRFLQTALGENDICCVPSAPGYCLYLQEAKYSNFEAKFDEQLLDVRRTMAKKDTSSSSDAAAAGEGGGGGGVGGRGVTALEQLNYNRLVAWRQQVQQHIMKTSDELWSDEWMTDMHNRCIELCCRRDAMHSLKMRSLLDLSESHASRFPSSSSTSLLENAPAAYRNVLRLLMEADQSGKWPSSSRARQQVMVEGAMCQEASGGDKIGGSFSVGYLPPPLSEPKGNALFPELMMACFELEKVLCPSRAPSSMIAINRHAQFKPHRDSGAAKGQTLSLIVALGDFVGGELTENDMVHDIRYTPLEFDGWMQRHSTLPFTGERFSLVWFSPCGIEEEDLWWWDEAKREERYRAYAAKELSGEGGGGEEEEEEVEDVKGEAREVGL